MVWSVGGVSARLIIILGMPGGFGCDLVSSRLTVYVVLFDLMLVDGDVRTRSVVASHVVLCYAVSCGVLSCIVLSYAVER